ncbi:MAG: sigma 54-interacting transcriptional regulator [Calditrichia bacterium]
MRALEARSKQTACVITSTERQSEIDREMKFAHFTLESSPDSIFWIDKKGFIQSVNQTACTQLGYSRAELCGMQIHKLNPDFSSAGWDIFWERLTDEKQFVFESSQRLKDGNSIPVEISAHHFKFEGISYACAFAYDISNRKLAAQELYDSEERHRTLYNHTPVMLHAINSETQITSVNDYWLSTLGYTREEVLGKRATDFLTEESKQIAFTQGLPNLRKMGSIRAVELQFLKKSGELIDIELSAIAKFNSQGNMEQAMAFLLDISERKKAKNALKEQLDFEALIADISNFIVGLEVSEICAGINYALRRIGEFSGVDRCYLFQFNDEEHIRNTHEWCSTNVDPQLNQLQNVDISNFSYVRMKLRKRQTLYVPRVSELGEEAIVEKSHWEDQEIKSLLNVPVVFKNQVIGFIGFDSVRKEKQWLKSEVTLLNVVAEILANLLHRKETGEALFNSEKRLAGILNSAMDAIITVNRSQKIVMFNHSAEKMFRYSAEEALNKSLAVMLGDKSAELLGSYIESSVANAGLQNLLLPEGSTALRSNREAFPIEATISHTQINSEHLFTLILRDINELVRANEALEELESKNALLQEELQNKQNYGAIIGSSASMQSVYKNIEMVANTNSTVLLLGETGTGKELLANAIHNTSSRKEQVLIKVNCGALPAGLIESELLGHEKGAFTGATVQKKGKFELADKGTIFLDEIGELPLEMQTKLLRVLQEQEFERVGGSQSLKVDVRIIAATNRNLDDEVRNGSFRADLFYRLNIFPIEIPPLRERHGDIPLLAHYFVEKFSRNMGKRIQGINDAALEKLQRNLWSGNVRELANILERAVILCQGRVLQEKHIAIFSTASDSNSNNFLTLEDMERQHIIHALEKTRGVLAGPSGAASLLNINRSTLWSRMRKLGIDAAPP